MTETPGKPVTGREGADAPDGRKPGTVREGSGRGPAGGAAATVREGAGVGSSGSSGFPSELADRFGVVRHLATSGGEADVFETEEAGSGARRLVKVYRGGYGVKTDALAKVRSIEDARVAGLYDFGQLGDGRWFEVQEFIDAEDLGSFRRSYGDQLGDRRLLEIVRELDQAVGAFHAAGLAHHDIKPENVLVRSRRPISLVLIDFGLAVSSWDNDAPMSNRHGTIHYQPPEAMAQQGGFARDRWSMGMTIAMVATGQVPYQGMADYNIMQALYRQEPPPLIAEIRDDRLRNLCRGLTRYDVDARWGADEVAAWLDGENPAVAEEHPRAAAAAPSVRFDGQDYTDPAALAVALLEHPAAAENQLKAAARRQSLLDQLLSVFGGPALNELDQRWSHEAPQSQQAIAELVVALDPAATPMLHGRPITPAELALIGHEATRGDAEASRIVGSLAHAPILNAWGSGIAFPEYVDVERRWRHALDSYGRADQAATMAGATRADLGRARAIILTAVLDADYAATLTDQRARAAPRQISGQAWYQDLLNDTNPGAVVAAIMYAPEAQRLATDHEERQRETARREQEAERRRREATRRRFVWPGFGAFGRAVVRWWLTCIPIGFVAWIFNIIFTGSTDLGPAAVTLVVFAYVLNALAWLFFTFSYKPGGTSNRWRR